MAAPVKYVHLEAAALTLGEENAAYPKLVKQIERRSFAKAPLSFVK